jgi:uncharacterized membrane protein YcfT
MNTHTIKPRYDWVDYAKGICIFAVVTLYSTKVATEVLGGAGWMQLWASFAAPFRMPDFFLLSGLFLARVIDRPWKGYLDKKVIHYTYFFLLWSLINLLILYALGERSGGLARFPLHYWSMVSSWPYQMLWFIQMLPAYFLFTRLTKKVPYWIMLPIAAVLHAFPVVHTDRMILDEFWNRYVFFYVGYVFAPFFFAFAAQAQKHVKLTLIGLVIWVIVNAVLVNYGLSTKPFVGLILGLIGAMAIISLGALAEMLQFAHWIRYLGQNSIVIYLAFFWPMKFFAFILAPVAIFHSNPGLFASAITILGLLGSLSLFWVINWRTKDRWLFRRPAWLTLK